MRSMPPKGAEVHPQASLSTDTIAQLIGRFMREPQTLATMAAAARSTGKPDATRLLAALTEAIASGRTAKDFREGARP